jgi:hypothetical protein
MLVRPFEVTLRMTSNASETARAPRDATIDRIVAKRNQNFLRAQPSRFACLHSPGKLTPTAISF